MLEYTTLLDVKWLLDFALGNVGLPGHTLRDGRPILPAWQDVPPEAVVELTDLRASTMSGFLPVAVLSYGWASKAHPDPSGEQLQQLIPALKVLAQSCDTGIGSSKEAQRGKPKAWGLLWDFAAFPQRGHTSGRYDEAHDDRTPEQRERFERGLRKVNVWYSAEWSVTLLLDTPMPEGAENRTPITRRGWCVTERRLSSITKGVGACLALSLAPAGMTAHGLTLKRAGGAGDSGVMSFMELVQACVATRTAPLSPEVFEQRMTDGMAAERATRGSGISFTDSTDATSVCIPQYTEAFLRLMGRRRLLKFGGCCWGADQLADLAASLEYAHAHEVDQRAVYLALGHNRLAGAVTPLVRALSSGALPNLEVLDLQHSGLTDDDALALAALLDSGRMVNLRVLIIIAHKLSATGVAALTAAYRSGASPSLKRLDGTSIAHPTFVLTG